MLLHKQKTLYLMDYKEKEDLKDIILVAINEITKFNPNKTDENRGDFGVDFSNISPFNPSMIEDVLLELGYEQGDLDTNGWECDYWYPFIHPDKEHFPPVELTGTAWVHECLLHGMSNDYEYYPHLEDNPKYEDRIENGRNLLSKAINRK